MFDCYSDVNTGNFAILWSVGSHHADIMLCCNRD